MVGSVVILKKKATNADYKDAIQSAGKRYKTPSKPYIIPTFPGRKFFLLFLNSLK
jgi:hypothetical protein